jgi:membrane protein DedA with SNARE-associated domain
LGKSEDRSLEGLQVYLAQARLFVGGEPVLFIIATGLGIAIVSVAQEVITYWAARLGGRRLVERMAARGWLRMDEGRIHRTNALFARWGVYLVIFGRVIPGIRALVSLPAGMSRMDFGIYLAAASGGAFLWNTLLVGVGYALGFHVTPLGKILIG